MVAASKKSWRWACTPLSSDRGEVSVLACVESLLAISISLGIAWYYQTITHIAISACLAPFLLLRTKRSTLRGLILLGRNGYRIEDQFGDVPFFIYIIFGPTLIKVIATVEVLISHPAKLFTSIPLNWKRIVFCTDMSHAPEPMTGMERLKNKSFVKLLPNIALYNLLFSHHAQTARRWVIPRGHLNIMDSCLIILYSLFLFLPSLMYRFSLKSTSLIWSPLLWIISSAQFRGPLKFCLDDIRQASMYNIMRAYSLMVLLLFLGKIIILIGPQAVIMNSDFRPLLEPLIEPARLPLWQVASALSAVLAWVIYVIADYHLRAIERKSSHTASEISIKWQLGVLNVTRTCLALYTIACTLYIAWKISADLQWPFVEFVLFPWN